jgi:hypothetical protein
MGPKRKRPPSGVVILTTGRTDQIAHDLVLAIFGFGSTGDLANPSGASPLHPHKPDICALVTQVSNGPEAGFVWLAWNALQKTARMSSGAMLRPQYFRLQSNFKM